GVVYSQSRAADTAIYTAVTNRWKYAYSVPDRQEYLFDRITDPKETRNRAGLPSSKDVVKELRAQTIAWLAEGGETAAYNGETWKTYPIPKVSDDPDTGLITQDPPGYVLNLPGYTD
ncbi:MAG: hypothetical protein HN368_22440, partial [Spirochaetales bacterium]|nr:hypothetical protein [Spirochaetales bacterium]